MKTYDIIVIGGGPVGSYTAYQLVDLGYDVGLFEKDLEVGKDVLHRFPEGSLGLQLCLLGHITDAEPSRPLDPARGGLVQLGDEVQQSCLARPIGAHQGDAALARYLEREALKDILRAIGFR